MRTVLIQAAMLGAITTSAPAATPPADGSTNLAGQTVSDGEGAAGSRGVRLAGAAAATFLFVPEATQSLLVTVGEGGEGKRGRRFRGYRPQHFAPYRRPHWYGPRPYGPRPYFGPPYR